MLLCSQLSFLKICIGQNISFLLLYVSFLISYFLSQIKAGPLSVQWFFKTWIQLLELLINLIRNASVCSSIILKNLYWSEFGFLVSLWLNFHFFVFFRFKIFWEWAGPAPAHFLAWKIKFGQKWAGPLSKLLKFLKLEKKFFLEKYFFLRVLWTSKLFWWKV